MEEVSEKGRRNDPDWFWVLLLLIFLISDVV